MFPPQDHFQFNACQPLMLVDQSVVMAVQSFASLVEVQKLLLVHLLLNSFFLNSSLSQLTSINLEEWMKIEVVKRIQSELFDGHVFA